MNDTTTQYSDPISRQSITIKADYSDPLPIRQVDSHSLTDTVYPNISWNNLIEQNVKEIGEKAKGYKIMHIQESRKFSQIHKRLMYTGIFLGPLAGILSSIGAILSTDVVFPIAATGVAFLSGIVVAITKYGKFEGKSSHHKIAASKYTSLESNVRRQLVLCRTDRVNAVQYLEYVGSNFDELFMASPLVSKGIYDNYVVIAIENGIFIPDEYGLMIKVDESYQKNKFNEMKNVSAININGSFSSAERIEVKIEQPAVSTVSTSFKELKRTGTFTHFPELNKYSDGRMEYEMQRMMGLK
jgi:hypothetical protein